MNEAQRVIEVARLKMLLVQAKVSILSRYLMYALCNFWSAWLQKHEAEVREAAAFEAEVHRQRQRNVRVRARPNARV
jgi:hypothetical protein